MPCYDLNGNAVPGTPQTCASLGGVWRDGVPQSLQQPEETVVGPLHFGDVGTSYGMGEGQQRSFAEPGLGYRDTDDFGNPLKTTDAFGDYQYDERVNRANQRLNHGMMRDYTNGISATETPNYQEQFQMTPFVGADGKKMSVAEVKRQQKDGSLDSALETSARTVRETPFVGAITDFLHYDPANMLSEAYTHITDPELRADVVKFIDENGATATIGAYLTYRLGKKTKILDKILPKKAGKVLRDKKTGRMLKGTGKKGVDVAGVGAGIAKGTIAASAIDQATDDPWLQSKLKGTAFENKDSTTVTPPYVGQKNSMGSPDPYTGLPSDPTLRHTTTGGGTGVTGGTGTAKKSSVNWDELAKLGQLMAHYGTPLSQRKEHPSKQWGAELAALQTAQARLAAAGNKTIFSKAGNKQHERALREKVARKMGKGDWLSLDPDTEELDAQVAEVAIAINQLISQGIHPDVAEKLVLKNIN